VLVGMQNGMNIALPRISVVVCTYNRSGFVINAIESLLNLNTEGRFTYEIVVVDDASTDDTAEVVCRIQAIHQDSVRYVRGTGAGVSAARNTGVEAARGEWIAFFDDDQLADRDWLCQLWRVLVDADSECVGGSRALDLSREELNRLSPNTRGFLGEIPREDRPRICRRNDLLCTGNLLVSRRAFDRAGGFDVALVRGGEDTDLFMRLRRIGVTCWFAPNAVVRHVIPGYRLEAPYLKWAGKRGGACYAERDYREWGSVRVIAIAVTRLVHAGILHGFRYVQARLARQKGEALGRECQILRATEYARHAFHLALRGNENDPVQDTSAEFRGERKLFQNQ
jgi:glycosyltransferase involved in cell wall biosynthesis